VTSPACTSLAGGPGIQGVGLAVAAPGLAVGSVDLHHDLAVGGQEAGEGGAVGAGALHPQATGSPSPWAQRGSCW
jgi:hypothetical protein